MRKLYFENLNHTITAPYLYMVIQHNVHLTRALTSDKIYFTENRERVEPITEISLTESKVTEILKKI